MSFLFSFKLRLLTEVGMTNYSEETRDESKTAKPLESPPGQMTPENYNSGTLRPRA